VQVSSEKIKLTNADEDESEIGVVVPRETFNNQVKAKNAKREKNYLHENG